MTIDSPTPLVSGISLVESWAVVRSNAHVAGFVWQLGFKQATATCFVVQTNQHAENGMNPASDESVMVHTKRNRNFTQIRPIHHLRKLRLIFCVPVFGMPPFVAEVWQGGFMAILYRGHVFDAILVFAFRLMNKQILGGCLSTSSPLAMLSRSVNGEARPALKEMLLKHCSFTLVVRLQKHKVQIALALPQDHAINWRRRQFRHVIH